MTAEREEFVDLHVVRLEDGIILGSMSAEPIEYRK